MKVSEDDTPLDPREFERVKRATMVGFACVKFPWLFILLFFFAGVPSICGAITTERFDVTEMRYPFLGWILAIAAFASAWLWWSISTPKWYLWALENTDDWTLLEYAAIRGGFVGNPHTRIGRFFARTSIWTPKSRAHYEELMRRRTPVEGPEAP